MDVSARWINDYLDPDATPEEQEEHLTMAGFPIEARTDLEDGDVRLDVELTSNRGDCLCHVGLAREIAARSGRRLKVPRGSWEARGGRASDSVSVTNREPDRCPRYTARIVRGATVRPSPAWLADRLRAIGQIPRNNIVDATNFVLFELGQPTHVFDLSKLKGPEIVVRRAKPKEPFLPIGEGESEISLTPEDLVIADAEDAVALAGVKGGALTAVTGSTTDLLIEAATFAPAAVRAASRRHRIASASGYRFERGVHAAAVDPAADRLVALILELAGGEAEEGVVADGAAVPAPREVSMRFDRARKILGIDLPDEAMLASLEGLGFEPKREGDRATCTVPAHRLDVEREIDLIEEVARMAGYERLPVADAVAVRVSRPVARVEARRAIANELAGMGFLETTTHSLVPESAAAPFRGEGGRSLRVGDERAKAAPILRPSVLASLLRVREHNRAHGVEEVHLFETAATFEAGEAAHRERVSLGLISDTGDAEADLRRLRGAIDRVVAVLAGRGGRVEVEPSSDAAWLAPEEGARIALEGRTVGRLGVLAPAVGRTFDVEGRLAVAEIELDDLLNRYPPESTVEDLPAFPSIKRDLSIVVEEGTRWADVERAVREAEPEHLESAAFVTVFRGRPVPKGKKSLTLRLRFRAEDRTLTHEEVDPAVEAVVGRLERTLGAEIRGGS